MSKILVKSAWGSDDPTKAAFPFLHANALAEGGHEVQIFLLGEAVSLMRPSLMSAILPGWLAAALGDVSADPGAGHPHPRLKCLFTGSWGPGCRSGWQECDLRQPADPGRLDRMGG